MSADAARTSACATSPPPNVCEKCALGLAGAHNQHGNLQVVAHGINGVAENQIFQATVAVSAHDDEVGLDLVRVADDLLAGGRRVADGGFDGDALSAEGLRDTIRVWLAGFDFGGGRVPAVNLAGDAFFYVQEKDASAVEAGHGGGVADGQGGEG